MDTDMFDLKPPIGFADFRELRQAEPKRLYVDKSGLISEVLRDDAKVLLFPRPRRFGKTLNLSMLRYFLEKNEQDLSTIFSDLAVWRDALSRNHFQQYPTIFVTFKDIKDRSFELTFESIREVIRQAYHEHREVLNSPALTAEQKDRYQLLLRSEGSEIIVRRALLDLTEYLSVVYNRQVVLLIDEYDTPIQQGFLQGFYDEAVDFFRNFYAAALKDNVYLFRGVLSGILRVARESLFSGLNNLVVRSLLDPEYSTSFGFTEEETLRITGAAEQAEMREKLKHWYDGYRFGGQVIYNPWSILRYLETRRFAPYWVSTGSDDVLYDLLTQRGLGILPEIDALLGGETLSKSIDVNLSLRDMHRDADVVWNFLLFSGYLKATVPNGEPPTGQIDLTIPNREVETAFENAFRKWIAVQLQGDDLGPVLLEALIRGDVREVEQLLSTLMQSASIHDVAQRPENFYHGIVWGILKAFSNPYEVRSNRESGFGRSDVLIVPLQSGMPGVVLEFKAMNRNLDEDFDQAFQRALQQMREQDYAAELRAVGAQPIHEFAVVFAGKRVRVRKLSTSPDTAVAINFYQRPLNIPVSLSSTLVTEFHIPQRTSRETFRFQGLLDYASSSADIWQASVTEIETGLRQVLEETPDRLHIFAQTRYSLAIWIGRLLDELVNARVNIYQYDRGTASWHLFLQDRSERTSEPAPFYNEPELVHEVSNGQGILVCVDGSKVVGTDRLIALANRISCQWAYRIQPRLVGDTIESPHQAEQALFDLERGLDHLADSHLGPFHLLTRAPLALIVGLGRRLRPTIYPPMTVYEYDPSRLMHYPALRFSSTGVAVALPGDAAYFSAEGAPNGSP